MFIDGVALGQTPIYDLQQCIEMARTKNPTVLQARLGLQINQIQLDQSKANRNPVVNSSANHNYNFGRSIDVGTNQFVTRKIQSNNFSITSAVTLFNGYQLQNLVKQNNVQLAVGKKDLEVINNNISLAVANAYLQILLAEEQLQTTIKQKEITEAQLLRAKLLYEAGKMSRSSVVNIEAQLAGDDLAIVLSQNNVRSGYAQLTTLIQAENYSSFLIDKPNINAERSLTVSEITEVLEKAQSQMPEVEREKLKMQTAMLGMKISKGAYYPKLSLIAGLNTVYSESRIEYVNQRLNEKRVGYTEVSREYVLAPFYEYDTKVSPFGTQLKDNFGQNISLSLSVPIYNNSRVKNNVKISTMNYEISKMLLDNTLSQLKNDVIQAYANWESAKARFTSSLQNEKAQKLNFDFTKERFDAGLLNSVELLNAKNLWSTAQGNTIQARYELVFRRVILDFYKGIPLSLQ